MDKKEKRYYIWAPEHNGFWKPDSMGYTSNIEEASLYSFTEASQIVNAPFVDDTMHEEDSDFIYGKKNPNKRYQFMNKGNDG